MNLPAVILIEQMAGADSTAKWKVYLDHIYGVFCQEIANAQLRFRGLPVKCRYHEPYDGKHASFWHLISEGRIEADRTPDLDRCARIPWIAPVIHHADDAAHVHSWEHERVTSRGRKTRVVLWLFQHDYAVILEPREEYCLLITTYCVQPGQKQKFEREWQTWTAQKSRGRV